MKPIDRFKTREEIELFLSLKKHEMEQLKKDWPVGTRGVFNGMAGFVAGGAEEGMIGTIIENNGDDVRFSIENNDRTPLLWPILGEYDLSEVFERL